MKILCPTDFSAASNNGIEYAARLARQVQGTLTLLNVQPLYMGDGVSLFAAGKPPYRQEAEVSAKILDETCAHVNGTFGVSCTPEVVPSFSSFESVVDGESGKYDLIVIGTNGIDNLYELNFGTHSFRLAGKALCPVLIVPEHCPFTTITAVFFVSASAKGDAPPVEQLKQFMAGMKSGEAMQVKVLHVSDNDTPESRSGYDSFCRQAQEQFGHAVTFDRIISEDQAPAIEDYMEQTTGATLAVRMEEHGFFNRLFHDNLARKLTASAFTHYPVLIFHK